VKAFGNCGFRLFNAESQNTPPKPFLKQVSNSLWKCGVLFLKFLQF